MAHRSGSRWPPPPPTTNGLSSEDSPCVMSSEDSHAVGPFGVPYRTTPPSRKAPNKQLQAVFLRLSPTHGLTHARILSSQAPRTRPAPNGALPTPPPRARRTYSLSCSKTAHNSRPRAAPARTHMRQDPARTAQAPTHPLSHRGTWFGTWQSHVPEDSPSRLFASLKRETVTVSCSTPVTRPGGETSPTKLRYDDTPPVMTPPYVWHLTHAAWNLLRRMTLARSRPAFSASPTRPPGRETCARGTQQTARPTLTSCGTNSGSGTRGTRGGGEETRGR